MTTRKVSWGVFGLGFRASLCLWLVLLGLLHINSKGGILLLSYMPSFQRPLNVAGW